MACSKGVSGRKAALKENIGKVLISFGKIMFGSLVFGLVLGREGAAVLLGEMPGENYMSAPLVITGSIVTVLFIAIGIFLVSKGQEDESEEAATEQ